MKNFVFRLDSSKTIGTGHMMRCLALANKLRSLGHNSAFVVRKYADAILEPILRKNFSLYTLSWQNSRSYQAPKRDDYSSWLGCSENQDAEEFMKTISQNNLKPCVVIYDHYGIAETWEGLVSPHVELMVCIDDLANRPHQCQMLIDQNYINSFETRYDKLVPKSCTKLLGPKYAIIREEFHTLKSVAKKRTQINSILVSYGGGDDCEATLFTATALIDLIHRYPCNVHLMINKNTRNSQLIRKISERSPCFLIHENPDILPELMAHSDLAIGAPGSMSWERCALGLPAILISIARNQEPIGESLHGAGACLYLGWHEKVNEKAILSSVEYLLTHPTKLAEMSKKAEELVDLKGIDRITAQILNKI